MESIKNPVPDAEQPESLTPDSAPLLAARRLRVADGRGNVCLRDLSLEILHGEVAALIGGTEAEKHCLFRCLDLLDPPDGGNVELHGQPVHWRGGGASRARRAIGMIFSNAAMFENLTVLDNVALAPGELLDQPPLTTIANAEKLLDFVGLPALAHALPCDLTRGQRQRLAIARALALKPQILLFDNPTANLSPSQTVEVLSLIHALAAMGTTMLLSIPDIDFVRENATRVLFLENGVIQEDGTPQELFYAPKSAAARTFINRNMAFYRELDARTFDLYQFDGEAMDFAMRHLVPLDKRKTLSHTLYSILVRILFPRISKIELSMDVRKGGREIMICAAFPGRMFDPMTNDGSETGDAARAWLKSRIVSSDYSTPAPGKNQLKIIL